MGAWSYDSYTNDNVLEYFDENPTEEEVIEYFYDLLNDYPGECDFEFAVSILIYLIRQDVTLPKKTLVDLKELIKYLIENGNFKYWLEKEKRIEKLKHELKIVQNLILNRNVKFGKLKIKPSEYIDLNNTI